MAQFIPIAGAWHGAWCWERVVPLLRSAGHGAHAVSLTGVGERAHLLSGEISLTTHIKDVLDVIGSGALDDVVLVGHSYAGMVITGAADTLLRERRPVLRHLVYLDTVAPHPGESWSSRQTPETVAARIEEARTVGGGIALPAPDASSFGLEGEEREWVNQRLTPQPFGTYQDPLSFDRARVASVPRTYIACTNPARTTLAGIRERVYREPGWRVVELSTGHDPMITMPKELGRILLRCAA